MTKAKSSSKAKGVEFNKESGGHDTREESRATGEVTTDAGVTVEAVSPAIPHGAEYKPEEEKGFSMDEQMKLVGDLEPGDKCYLPTDAEGNVSGPAVKDRRDAGQWAVKVEVESGGQYLITPSGAPIAKRMNPDTVQEEGGTIGETPEEKHVREGVIDRE